jgi:membrane protein DedA with SNARE-associated domain
MLTTITTAILGMSGWPVYAAVGTLAFAEAAAFVGLVLPGETALLVGGVLAGRHQVALLTLLIVAIIAAIAGDTVGYLVGYRFGPRLRRTWLGRRIKPDHWARAERFVARRGAWAVIAGRWVGVLRALVPTAAGMTRMPYHSFVSANAAGGLLWAVAVVLLGYTAGTSYARVHALLGQLSLTVLVAFAAVAAGAWVIARRRRSRAGTETSVQSS